MKYSIILPVLNGGNLIKECVTSILNQTYPYFNLIILDSGSTDDTISYIQSLSDSRIQLHITDKPLSIEESWHRIINIQKNEFITLIGHDDLLLPDYLATMDSLIAAYPEASLYQTHFTFIDATGNKKGDCKAMPLFMKPEEFVEKVLKLEIDINGTGFMCRAEDYDRFGGIPLYPNLLYADYALWFSIVNKGSVVVSQDVRFSYRVHQNMSQTADQSIYVQSLEKFIEFLKEKKQKNIFYDAIKKFAPFFIIYYCKSIAHKMLRVQREKRNGISVSDFIQKFEQHCRDISDYENSTTLRDDLSIKIAIRIDQNRLFSYLFRVFKKLYKKPVL